MNPSSDQTKREILAKISAIDLLLRGKITEKQTPAGNPNGHKLQRWRQGKNQSLHVPDDRLDLYRRAVENHERFKALMEEYVEVCEQDLLRPGADFKKKRTKR